MKKKRLLKTLSFSSLAVLMAAAGTFAFAPLGASPSTLANADVSNTINTVAGNGIEYAPSPLGLDPENDPVIYTTASGLEIKYGGATAYTANGGGNETATVSYSNLGSGKPLSGYPYFTMGTYSGYAVNWVIIGKSTSISNTTATTYDTLTNWQSKTAESPTYKKFFDQTYEATTPAGIAIKNNNTLSDYTARKLTINYPSFSSLVIENSEIPSNCVLAISECVLTSCAFNNSGKYQGSTLKSTIDALYSNNLALTSAQKSMIQPMTLKTWYVSSSVTSTNCYLFPLASQGYNMDENLYVDTYLNDNSLRWAYTIGTTTKKRWWFRSSHDNTANYATFCETNGSKWMGHYSDTSHYVTNSQGVRPACVIKLG